jgi:hypothetical protein
MRPSHTRGSSRPKELIFYLLSEPSRLGSGQPRQNTRESKLLGADSGRCIFTCTLSGPKVRFKLHQFGGAYGSLKPKLPSTYPTSATVSFAWERTAAA